MTSLDASPNRYLLTVGESTVSYDTKKDARTGDMPFLIINMLPRGGVINTRYRARSEEVKKGR